MPILLAVVLGSALGGGVRFLTATAVERVASASIGTLAVNVAGSFLLGLLVRLVGPAPGLTPGTRAFLTVGFCGGFTTFSTFSLDVVRYLEDGSWGRAAGYAGGSVLLSVAALALGYAAAGALGGRTA